MTNSGTNHTVTVTDSATGKETILPVLHGSAGAPVIDIRSLYKETGLFTFDPGYTATGACESKVTYIDGDNGVLQYRGYPIEQLAEHSNYMEVCYLLMNGELPNAAEYKNFEHTITNHTMVHDQLANFFRGFRRDATRWPFCAVSLVRYPRSIMTRPTSKTHTTAWLPAIA